MSTEKTSGELQTESRKKQEAEEKKRGAANKKEIDEQTSTRQKNAKHKTMTTSEGDVFEEEKPATQQPGERKSNDN